VGPGGALGGCDGGALMSRYVSTAENFTDFAADGLFGKDRRHEAL